MELKAAGVKEEMAGVKECEVVDVQGTWVWEGQVREKGKGYICISAT